MTLLEEIQQAAVDGNSDLSALLRKCKLLAARLGSKPLEDWLLWESNGYPKEAPVPKYRIWRLKLKGHFAGSFGSAMNNVYIPMACVPVETRKAYEHYENRNSIAAIEDILKKSTDGGGTATIHTSDLSLVLGQKVFDGYNCIEAWAEAENGQLVEVMNSVRNRILDFSLAIWKEAPDAGQGTEAGKGLKVARINQIFNTTVHNGSVSLVGNADHSTISFGISSGDFESLAKALGEKGVDREDLVELKKVIQEKPTENGFGPKVSAWMGKMIQKAANGSWEVGVAAAGTLLSQALAKYYGIG
ncbi:MAG: hypothetical protein Q8T11_01570 [Elusimicrobiota bacterium]|nr:hypothetical protein [Elusimicrobiota bacterium]